MEEPSTGQADHRSPNTARPSFHRSLLLFTILMSLVMGAIGGAGTVYVLTQSRGALSTGSVGLPVKQKIVLEESSKFIEVAKQVSPSVVSISTSRNVQDFFGQVFQQKGGGTGFVVSSDGLIATNNHVVSDKNATYTIILNDGTTYDAKVKATDPIFDFAILKIEAKNLKAVDFGNSDDLQIGQWVMAIGNALAEFQNTVTAGVISAKERNITAGDSSGVHTETLEGLLQTDAAINPGNSGGPLLNLSGQVVGVNTAVAEAQGIGFAIPSNVLKPAVESVVKNGRIIRPALGVRYVPVTKQLATDSKLPVDHGAYIQPGQGGQTGIVSGSAADQAGLKEGDIITAINNQSVDENHSLARLIQQYQVGQKVKVTYFRDGKEESTEVTLQELKA